LKIRGVACGTGFKAKPHQGSFWRETYLAVCMGGQYTLFTVLTILRKKDFGLETWL
jgi:hypothetical protein